MKAAVIGIGSNSVRMLVTEIEGQTAHRLRRDRAGTRLFAGLDEDRRLSAASMRTTADAVARMAREARAEGAEDIRIFATSATRDAANADEFARLLLEETGVTLDICSGQDEAALSYLGAAGGGFAGVIDIGGGSTEVIVGHGLDIDCAFSCQMGAVRLFRQLPIASPDDLPEVIAAAQTLLEEKLQKLQAHPTLTLPSTWTGTGGTFTTLAAMVRGTPWTDRTCMHGTPLPLARVEEQAQMLAGMTMEQRLALPGLQPGRADIVVHGICILIACMRRMGISVITVSEYGNLDGYTRRAFGLRDGFSR